MTGTWIPAGNPPRGYPIDRFELIESIETYGTVGVSPQDRSTRSQAPISPKPGCNRLGRQGTLLERLRGTQRYPKAPQRPPKTPQRHPKTPQKGAWAVLGPPPGTQKRSQGSPKAPQGTPNAPRDQNRPSDGWVGFGHLVSQSYLVSFFVWILFIFGGFAS